jgi:hypothetical protein
MTDTILPEVSARPTPTGPRRQRPSRPVLVGAAVALVLVVAGGAYELTKSPSSTPSAAAPSPVVSGKPATPQTLAGVLAQVGSNALAEKSASETVRDVSGKSGVVRYADYSGLTDGIQRISLGAGHSTVRVVGTTTYFNGDRTGLMKFYQLSAAQAKQIGDKWVPLVAGQSGYTSITVGITLVSTLNEVRLVGPLHRLPSRIKDGQHVFGIEGTAVGGGQPKGSRGTLWISVGAHGLPVEFDSAAKGNTEVVTFSRWGHTIAVSPPAHILGQSTVSS